MNLAPAAFNLLLIDDSLIVGKRLIAMIETVPFIRVIGQATTVRAGLSMFNEHHPEIVLLDITLPDGKGVDVLTQIKNLRKQTKVIVMSNSNDGLHEKKFLELGADYFLDKTNDFPQLTGVLIRITNILSI